MCGGAYMRGAYTWSNTSVKEKVGLSVGGLYAGGGAYRRRNTVFCVDRLLFVVDNTFSQPVIDNFDDTQQSFESTTKSHPQDKVVDYTFFRMSVQCLLVIIL